MTDVYGETPPVCARLIVHHEAHHGAGSGYDQLVKYVGTTLAIVDFTRRSTRLVPAPIANWLVRRAAVPHYGYSQVYFELSAAVDMLRRSRCVYHFLYGDTAYHHLGRVPRIHGNRVAATFHFPPNKLRQALPSVGHLADLDAAITVSRSQAAELANWMDASRIHFVPHGIDTSYFKPSATAESRQKSRCLFVGVHLRDVDTLVSTVELLHLSRPDVVITVVSAPEYQARFHELRQVDFRTNLTDQELLELYQSSTCLLLPLLDATANNSLLEAMACGLPIVTSDVGGVRDYVTDKTAALVPPHDARALAQATTMLLADVSRQQSMAIEARRQAEAFSWPKVGQMLSRVYSDVLERAPASRCRC